MTLALAPLDDVTKAIGENVAKFFELEMKAGRIPSTFLPVQRVWEMWLMQY